jgi:prepilin-type N-terminal cleavage/methylation domain-containing protein
LRNNHNFFIIKSIMQWAQKQKGFTIVELLIVVVVIAILAAITIVSYNGITSRAKASQYAADASIIAKKAEAYNADPDTGTTGYPTSAASFPTSSSALSALPSGLAVVYTSSGGAGAMTNNVITGTTPPSNGTVSNPLYIHSTTGVRTYTVKACGGTGMQIFYPDPTGTAAKNIIVGTGC